MRLLLAYSKIQATLKLSHLLDSFTLFNGYSCLLAYQVSLCRRMRCSDNRHVIHFGVIYQSMHIVQHCYCELLMVLLLQIHSTSLSNDRMQELTLIEIEIRIGKLSIH